MDAAEGVELVVEIAVAFHGAGGDVGIGVAHGEGGFLDAEQQLAETAGVEDARPGQVFGVAAAGVLREVADLAGALDLAARREGLAGQRLGHGRLAGAVAADEADLVAPVDPERDVGHEEARADADLEIVHGEHSRCPIDW
jgi:hypothetical protein